MAEPKSTRFRPPTKALGGAGASFFAFGAIFMKSGNNGKLLAAVQDQCVEIRSAKDDFTSIIGKCQVPKDPKPQWRRVAWSYDCTLLAYAESMGTVRVFDLMGRKLSIWAIPSLKQQGEWTQHEQCEIKLAPKRSRLETRAGEEEEGEEDSDSDQEISAKTRYFGYIKQGLYLVTEMERFALPRKRPRTITKNYRLVSLRSTTPEELYQRKIESEEYEEALSLAQTYGLDTDLVYQRQWRKSAVDCALSLIRLGMERNIPGLLVLCDNLVTLEALVYEAGMVVEPSLPDESEFLYAAQPALLRYRSARLAVAEVMDWYRNRAEEIEHYARQKTEVTTALHDMVDQLEHILSVSEILEKHGLEKPISYVKNTQSSSEEARKLMVRLTRHTGRKQPPVSESHWRVLLQDMLTMQQNVYTCLDSDACYEIFTESLLCSSRLENIHLAGQMMHCSACSINPPTSIAHKGKTQYRVSYEKSIDLVLAASREYFNSSTNLTDICMDLARCCLQLITDRPAAIQEELDLIQALGCLEEFGVKILPLQVRLRSDRIGLIKECICQSPTCYKQSTKLLGLAELLRVAGEDPEERRGQVLVFLVEQALRFHDYKAANVHCQELMATGYSKSWDVCSQLGQSEGYQDLATRQELMAFALTHCPPSSIELLLAASSSLQTEDEVCVPGSNSADLFHWTTATTMKVLSNTTTTTKAVLQAVSDGQWWKKSLTYLRPLQSEVTYDTYQHIPVESLAEVLLRTGKLAETKTEGEEVFPTTEDPH
ncbi:NBAS [Cervus elaphus hippelaphus]|uniref:NBAS n=1 Tax=Cervus elaphus hippelaphus TaxID=46360 RepID=A0A212CVT3_CEREH|nr:NBAS [Cervus elaphus hippelaphus]